MREIVNAKQTQVHPGNPAGVAAEALFKRALVTWPILPACPHNLSVSVLRDELKDELSTGTRNLNVLPFEFARELVCEAIGP